MAEPQPLTIETGDNMRSTVVRILLGSAALITIFQPAVRADKIFKLPCAQVVQIGAEKFVNVYGAKAGGSELDYDNAADYYYRCRREHNDLLAKKLTASERSQVNLVRQELKGLSGASSDLEYAAMGGGTMYGHLENREFAYREELIGNVIQWMIDPPGMSAGSVAAAESAWPGSEKHLAKMKTVPNLVELHGAEYTAYRRKYLQDLAEMNIHWQRLKHLVHTLPESKGAGLVGARISEIVDGTYHTLHDTH